VMRGRSFDLSLGATRTLGLSGSLPENEGDGLLVEMSIGEFARRSRLSPKTLRLYDGLGLLSPTRIDELRATATTKATAVRAWNPSGTVHLWPPNTRQHTSRTIPERWGTVTMALEGAVGFTPPAKITDESAVDGGQIRGHHVASPSEVISAKFT
jgi:hypothetical protein